MGQLRKKIQEFYEEDINSRICPGKKDFVKKNKIRRQKRFLLDTIKNLYLKYLKINPHPKISYRLFCRYRPFWVKAMNVADRDTCKCVTHANMELMVDSLYSNKIISGKTPAQVIKDTCCNDHDENCLLRECSKCKNSSILYNDYDENLTIQYFKWLNLNQAYFDKKTQTTKFTKKIAKAAKQVKVSDFVQQFECQLKSFMCHSARIGHQNNFIKTLKESLQPNELILHCDFSENYSLKYSQEIQSYHFGGSRQQITMHTSVAYSNLQNTGVNVDSFCTLSESLDHNPPAIWAHLFPLFKFYANKGIRKLHFLSDSPSTQYRNKDMFSFIANQLKKHFNDIEEVTWNYSEPGHGKGAPDGIGGVCKHTADRIVAQGQDISTFQNLVLVLREHCTGVHFFEITNEEIQYCKDLIKNTKRLSFHGTMKVRQIKTFTGTRILFLRSLSCLDCQEFCKHFELGQLNYNNGTKVDREISKSTFNATERKLKNSLLLSKRNASHKKLKYEDVYSDEENTNEPICSKSSTSIKTGSYILVNVKKEKNKIKDAKTFDTYRYAAVCQSDVDNDGEVTVAFLKIISDKSNRNEQVFRLDEQDKSCIEYDQIVKVLPQPNLVLKGNRVYYKFPEIVDIFESA